MELTNTFDVAAEPDVAWRTVGDMEQVALCLPGATIESRDGDTYRGRVAIKVGPISMGMGGVATVLSRDDAARTMEVRIEAEDLTGQGTVEATMAVRATPSPAGTAITITTTMQLGGKVAQFGTPLITQVSGRIVKQVAKRIGELVESRAGDGSGTHGSAAHAPGSAPQTPPSPPFTLAHGAHPTATLAIQLAAVVAAGVLLGWSLGRSLRLTTRGSATGRSRPTEEK